MLAALVALAGCGRASTPEHTTALSVPAVRNITLYRATPLRYDGIGDKNSGDPGGDLKFGLWEVVSSQATHWCL